MGTDMGTSPLFLGKTAMGTAAPPPDDRLFPWVCSHPVPLGRKIPPSHILRLGVKVARLDATVKKKICTILMPVMAEEKQSRRLQKGDAWTVLQLNIEIAVDHEWGIFGLTPG